MTRQDKVAAVIYLIGLIFGISAMGLAMNTLLVVCIFVTILSTVLFILHIVDLITRK